MRRSPLLLSALFVPVFLVACQPGPDAEPHSVTVSGEGEISVAPEIATVRMAVEARAPDLAAAQQQAAEVVDTVLKLTEELGIKGEDVQTTQLHVQPEFDWNEGRQTLRGYLVQRNVRVELEDLAKLGPLLERAMRAGVNNIGAPELSVKDPRKLHREVLALAAADAKANARALADTLDASLGKVRHVNALEGHDFMQPKMEMRMAAAAVDARSAEDDYTAGRITVRAMVQAEFELR